MNSDTEKRNHVQCRPTIDTEVETTRVSLLSELVSELEGCVGLTHLEDLHNICWRDLEYLLNIFRDSAGMGNLNARIEHLEYLDELRILHDCERAETASNPEG